MVQALRQPENSLLQSELREQVQELCQQFPIPSVF